MMDTIWIKVTETGKTVEVGRSAGNGMISSGHAVQVSRPEETFGQDSGVEDSGVEDSTDDGEVEE